MAITQKQVIIINPITTLTKMFGTTLSIPYGPLYLAESLIRKGYTPHIIYTSNDEALLEIDALVSSETLCFGIATMSGTQLSNALDIAQNLKEKYPHIPLIWGGVHITALPEQTLNSDLVDLIIWGEGEDTLPLVLDALERNDLNSLAGQPGIGIKENGKFLIGPNSGYTVLENRIFELPYHLLDMDRHCRKLKIGPKREFQIWTSRGCPYRCNFCSNSSKAWPNTKMRNHSIAHIVNDVSILYHKYGADCITFADEGFLQNEERFVQILEAIRQENIFISYRFSARIDILLRLKPETWKLMKQYGVIAISTAPESGSQRILDYMGKRITLEQIYKVDELLTKHKFFKAFNVLVCTPKESRDDLKETLRLICNLAETSMYCPYPIGTLHKYIPLPGTQLYEDAIQSGFVPPERLEDWKYFDFEDMKNTRNIVRPWISDSDFQFVEKATTAIELLNDEFTGEKADIARIKEHFKNIRKLIEE